MSTAPRRVWDDEERFEREPVGAPRERRTFDEVTKILDVYPRLESVHMIERLFGSLEAVLGRRPPRHWRAFVAHLAREGIAADAWAVLRGTALLVERGGAECSRLNGS